MTSRDLATTETLEEIKKLEAASMKSSVRYEDAYAPVRYTKKVLEDADALQAIREGIAGKAQPEEVLEMEDNHVLRRAAMAGGDDAEQDDGGDDKPDSSNRDSRVTTQNLVDSPEQQNKKDLPAEPARPTPQLAQMQQRQSSFSLSSVLGHAPDLPTEAPPSGDEEDEDEEGGFNDGFIDETDEKEGPEIDYSGRSGKKEKAVLEKETIPSAQTVLERMPIVWRGTVS
jgi:hypothetical protein